jgi:hypothetical protein
MGQPRPATAWFAAPDGGRRRGLGGLVRAWLGVLVAPRAFFEEAVAPGDQAPALTFAMAVVLAEEATRLALVPGAVPVLAGGPIVSAALVVGLATVLVAPVGLHLVAALQTVLLGPLVGDRAGIDETVQVLAYAAAPCALAGPPSPGLRALCAGYATVLLVVGLATVHGTSLRRAAAAGALPAAVVFGYGFRGVAAVADQLAAWYLI